MNRWRKQNKRRTLPVSKKSPAQKSKRAASVSHRPLIHPAASMAAALRFLTILPLPGQLGAAKEELASAVPFFPAVGLLLGCIAAAVAWVLPLLLPPLPAAVLLTLLCLAFSGGLHLDGLADTADGFFSARSQERMLEIMRDSAAGPMGVTALVMLLLLKTACIAALGNRLLPAVFLLPFAGRTAILLLMAMLPYVRQGGLGSLFAPYFHSRAGWQLALIWLLLLFAAAWIVADFQGLAAAFAVLLVVALFAVLCCRKIGGVTGDTLGAVCELAETTTLLAFAVKQINWWLLL